MSGKGLQGASGALSSSSANPTGGRGAPGGSGKQPTTPGPSTGSSSYPSGAAQQHTNTGTGGSQQASVGIVYYCNNCSLPLNIVDNSDPAQDPERSFASSLAGGRSGSVSGGGFLVPDEESQQPLWTVAAHSCIVGGRDGMGSQGEERGVGRIARLLEIASGAGPATFPLCVECVNGVSEDLDRQIAEAEDAKETFRKVLKELEEEEEREEHGEGASSSSPSARGRREEADEEDERELKKLREEEEKLKKEIREAEESLEESMSESRKAERLVEEVEKLERSLWRQWSQHLLALQSHEREKAAVNAAIEWTAGQLSKLKNLHVISDCFHIWHDGQFGTINGFRLGRPVQFTVPWAEVNAAWGQVCLLLDVICRRHRVELEHFRLIPRGSCSLIYRKSDRAEVELYGSEGGIARLLWGRRFDQAMVSFLAAFAEVSEKLLGPQGMERLPYGVEGDKIGGFSIRLQFNNEERWTKACKFLLIDLKCLVAALETANAAAKED
uniref:Atg6 BARA domain-containing protein n=1 Tax=Chromera velia CCMP2878 TaxID=1169474 RepID=A0A0G4HHU2_9ALVE|eukprot:Cvel_6919.t1-p1 / transcript=Cvel_6919.t1 / gene=Cvel_6919 / organism=Chromera_velia_CCMP2878 / gene_product=Beclin-1-like protein, putative / transcript_product=Beclin-1-like protein, putative / location=Cvel_scaffold350:23281-29705(+) / protein_length=498 / sequence_SO=supercontig / SO=protein_coding / is_pseudo=false